MMNSKIPKRIIQTGKSLDLPPLLKATVANIRLLNPDFEYLFFNDEQVNEFIEENFREYRDIFYSFRYPIQRYDFFRYLAVYHFGGFYLDLDILLSENLSDLIENSCVFTFEKITVNNYLKTEYNMDWDIGNYAFGAVQGHTFIRTIIENCVRAQTHSEWAEIMLKSIHWFFRKDAYVLCTTGPGLVSRTYAENRHIQSTVKILFPEDIYDRRYWNLFGRYGVHIMTSSWRKKRNKLHQAIWNYFYLKTENRNIRLGQLRHKSQA